MDPRRFQLYAHGTCQADLSLVFGTAVGLFSRRTNEWRGRSDYRSVIPDKRLPRWVEQTKDFRLRASARYGRVTLAGVQSSSDPCAGDGVPSSATSPGMRCFSSTQSPRSMSRHRSLQKGRHVCSGVHSTGFSQVGHLTMVGFIGRHQGQPVAALLRNGPADARPSHALKSCSSRARTPHPLPPGPRAHLL